LPTWINTTDLGSTTSTSYTASYTISSGANQCLLIKLTTGADPTGSSMSATYNGVAMAGPYAVNTDWNQYFFVLTGPATGANNIVASTSGSAMFIAIIASEYDLVNPNQVTFPNLSTTDSIVEETYSSVFYNPLKYAVVVGWSQGGSANSPGTSGSFITRFVNSDGSALLCDYSPFAVGNVTLTTNYPSMGNFHQGHLFISLDGLSVTADSSSGLDISSLALADF
jgi:hypothetical protein